MPFTGVPLVLNTSFNVFPGEPIVESPRDALRAFLGGKGPQLAIERLVLHSTILRRRPCPLAPLLVATTPGSGPGLAQGAPRGGVWDSLVPRRRVGAGTRRGAKASPNECPPTCCRCETRLVARLSDWSSDKSPNTSASTSPDASASLHLGLHLDCLAKQIPHTSG